MLAALLVLFAGCANEPAPETETAEWDRNATEHWQLDENGEKQNAGEHELDDQNNCTVCGCGIVELGDGSILVGNYDEEYRVLRETYYTVDGQVDKDLTYSYTFDEEGNMVTLAIRENGELVVDSLFAPGSDGFPVLVTEIVYNEEGRTVSEYSENFCVGYTTYSKDGDLLVVSEHELSEDKDGYKYISKEIMTDYRNNTKTETEYNEYGYITVLFIYELKDGAEELIHTEVNEYDFDDEGKMLYHSVASNGGLNREFFYDWYEEDGLDLSFCSKEIVYNEDGSYTVYEYNVNEELIGETAFDENGNKI